MGDWGVHPTDVAVFGILLVSGLLAFARGLVREVLGVAGWVGAAFVTLYAFPAAAPLLRDYVSPRLFADALTVVGVFVLTLAVLSAVSHAVGNHIRASSLNAVDRSLGFAFGLLRGAVVVCVGYMLLVWLSTGRDLPGWVAEARSLPMVQAGADTIRRLLPAEAAAATTATAEQVRGGVDAAEKLREISTPKPQGAAPAEDTGYNQKDRSDINRLTGTHNAAPEGGPQ